MRHISIFILSIIVSSYCFGQDINPYTKEPFYNKYYPENKTFKRNRIKYVIDSSEFILPSKFNVKLYDTLGRLIGDINRSIDSFNTPYIYSKTGDTTFRLKYNADRTQLLCFERFVQNKKGQVVSYLDCCNYYFKNDNYYVGYEEFYYDEKGRLKTKLSYFKEDYPGKVSHTINIKRTDLQLNDVIYYSYKTLKKGNTLIIGKHASGKPEWRATDSIILDKQKRIIRFNSFSKMASMGEMVQNNVNSITEYKYSDSTLTITDYTTYCIAPFSDFKCLEYSHPDKNITIIVYNGDKTKKVVYGFYETGEKYIKDKYEYVYF